MDSATDSVAVDVERGVGLGVRFDYGLGLGDRLNVGVDVGLCVGNGA